MSGLELVLRRKLGIRDVRNGSISSSTSCCVRSPATRHQTRSRCFARRDPRDPYSLQISLVFPDWPARYQDVSFKQFVEETVREQTPAHLTAYVRLAGPSGDGRVREPAYADWLHQWRNHRLADLGL